ncbi:SAICAR synthase-like protein [Nadsonia fulvescens var. elongata DSM 6958]|uniref:Kinase n=1 Tax=Nadsonia fulvescens var. elongata DSM 6958 TaxID=857566 RepID=A0A1E3PM10_9ASCO|nr:SAICAR synthase-like protein [Nadsonia fulvescens var. elongata DSM 6958]
MSSLPLRSLSHKASSTTSLSVGPEHSDNNSPPNNHQPPTITPHHHQHTHHTTPAPNPGSRKASRSLRLFKQNEDSSDKNEAISIPTRMQEPCADLSLNGTTEMMVLARRHNHHLAKVQTLVEENQNKSIQPIPQDRNNNQNYVERSNQNISVSISTPNLTKPESTTTSLISLSLSPSSITNTSKPKIIDNVPPNEISTAIYFPRKAKLHHSDHQSNDRKEDKNMKIDLTDKYEQNDSTGLSAITEHEPSDFQTQIFSPSKHHSPDLNVKPDLSAPNAATTSTFIPKKESTTGSREILVNEQTEDKETLSSPPTHPLAVELTPFKHKVGGHTAIFRFSHRAVCKALVKRENLWYEAVELRHSELLKFMPKYIGVLNVRHTGPVDDGDVENKLEDGDVENYTLDDINLNNNKLVSSHSAPNLDQFFPEVVLDDNRHIIPESLFKRYNNDDEDEDDYNFNKDDVNSSEDELFEDAVVLSPDTTTPSDTAGLLFDPSNNSLKTTPSLTSSSLTTPILSRSTLSSLSTSLDRPSTLFPIHRRAISNSHTQEPKSFHEMRSLGTSPTNSFNNRHATAGIDNSWGSTIVNHKLQELVLSEVFAPRQHQRRMVLQQQQQQQSQQQQQPDRPRMRHRYSSSSISSVRPSFGPQKASSSMAVSPAAASPITSDTTNTTVDACSKSSSVLIGSAPTSYFDHHFSTLSEFDQNNGNRTEKNEKNIDDDNDINISNNNVETRSFSEDTLFEMDAEDASIVSTPCPTVTAVITTTPTTNIYNNNNNNNNNRNGHKKLPRQSSLRFSNPPSAICSPGVVAHASPGRMYTRVERFILLEDLTSGLSKPCVLDLKMGTRQYGIHATVKKQASQATKCAQTTSRQLGTRICGMQVWDRSKLEFVYQDKYFGRKVRAGRQFRACIKRYLYDGLDGGWSIVRYIPTIVARINALEAIVKKLDGYRLYGSSLLMIYDGNCVEKAKKGESGIDIRIIDFAQCITGEDPLPDDTSCAPRHLHAPDKGYLRGLKSLKRAFRIIWYEVVKRDLYGFLDSDDPECAADEVLTKAGLDETMRSDDGDIAYLTDFDKDHWQDGDDYSTSEFLEPGESEDGDVSF